jgi:hypothetical protein
MSNSYSTITQITNESMRVAHQEARFLNTVERQYDDSFAKTGAKIGSSLRIRKPDEFVVTTASRVMDVNEQAESYETLTLATQYHVDMYFTSDEMTLSLDKLSERKIKPAMKKLISAVENTVLTGCTQATYNVAGTAGTALAASGSLAAFTAARAKINQGLAPLDQRSMQIDSLSMGNVTTGLAGIFNPVGKVSEAFNSGVYKNALGMDWYENDHVYAHTVGSDVTVSTSASSGATDGGTTITMNSTDGNVNKGDVFTLPKVYACDPETKQSTGALQQWVCTAASTGAITVSPTMYWSGAKQNVCNSSGGASVVADFDSEVMTFVGTAAASYRNPLAYHKSAFAFVTADLPIMGPSEDCYRLTQDGFSLRVWKSPDIVNDRLLMRIDMLFGYAAIRPAWACRLVGAAL